VAAVQRRKSLTIEIDQDTRLFALTVSVTVGAPTLCACESPGRNLKLLVIEVYIGFRDNTQVNCLFRAHTRVWFRS
jgi:hypothetical protein